MTTQVSLDSKYNPCRCIQHFKCHVTQIHKIETQETKKTDDNGNDLHEYMMQTNNLSSNSVEVVKLSSLKTPNP